MHARLHAGEFEGDVLVGSDGATEHIAALGVAHRLVEAALGRSGAQRGESDASLVEGLHEVCEPAATLAEQVGLWHAHVVEEQRMRIGGMPTDLVVGGKHGETRRRGRHQNSGELLLDRAV